MKKQKIIKEYNSGIMIKDPPLPSQDEYEAELKKLAARKQADAAMVDAGKKTTKQSFEQAVWRQYVYDIDTARFNFESQIKLISKKIKLYSDIVSKWSKNKNIDPNKIAIGQKIISVLNIKLEKLKRIVSDINEGDGKWWNIDIDVENGRKFIL